jgi:glycosyltransferase involved in cell wall biosynthesis
MIVLLAYISVVFLGLRLLVVCVNALFHFSRKDAPSPENVKLSVLIPARNEEENIGRILDCLIAQDYRDLEILICDDHSTDDTPAILEEYASKYKEIAWFRGEALKPGWTGKNFACHQLSARAGGDILLFVDADMEVHGDILSHMLAYMKKRRLMLLSIFPKQLLLTLGERATVPIMNWILLSLLPLPMVLFSPRSSFSAANGQFIMFRANVYHKLQPHSIVRSNPVEDIAIMRLYKKEWYRCATLLGDKRVQCRMYHGYKEAIAGFSKNVMHFFSGNLIWTFFYIFFTTFGLLFVALWSLPVFWFSLAAAMLGRMLISLTSHQQVFKNLLLVPVQHISFLRMTGRALRQNFKGNLEWKGRKIDLT